MLLFLSGCIFIYQTVIFNDHKLHVVICDAGQGDAIFIRTPQGSDVLIDGGPDSKVLSCLSSHMPFWDRTIEIMFLTHPHADHLTGLIDVVKRYRVLSFVTEEISGTSSIYEELMRQLEEHNVPERFLYQGDRFAFKDGVVLKTLWPTEGWVSKNSTDKASLDANSLSVIELLTYKNFKALFTGDAQAQALEKVDLMVGEVDVLKVPHHGSKTGLNQDVLEILKPKISAISVGAKNRYGHPDPFVLDLLNQTGTKTLRTDQVGEIEVVSDGETWKIIN